MIRRLYDLACGLLGASLWVLEYRRPKGGSVETAHICEVIGCSRQAVRGSRYCMASGCGWRTGLCCVRGCPDLQTSSRYTCAGHTEEWSAAGSPGFAWWLDHRRTPPVQPPTVVYLSAPPLPLPQEVTTQGADPAAAPAGLGEALTAAGVPGDGGATTPPPPAPRAGGLSFLRAEVARLGVAAQGQALVALLLGDPEVAEIQALATCLFALAAQPRRCSAGGCSEARAGASIFCDAHKMEAR